MILSDNQNCGGNVMTYTENNSRMPTLEPTTYCDMMHTSSADVPTFVAMLNDAYDMDISNETTEDVCDRLEHYSDSENHTNVSSISDDEEPMNVCGIPVKLERPQFLTIPPTSFPISNTSFLRQERKSDVLLSDHKALPDINFFIKTPKKNSVFADGRKCSFETSGMDVDQPSGSIEENATNCDMKQVNYADLDSRTCCQNRTIKPMLKVERSNEIPINDSTVNNISNEKSINYHYFVKCENSLDNYTSFTSAEVTDPHRQFIPIIEHHTPRINCGPTPPTGNTFNFPQRHRPDDCVFYNSTYTGSSPHYLSPVDIVDQKGYLNLNHQDPNESSYSSSPCSTSSSTSPSESSISYPISTAIIQLRKDFHESPTLQLDDSENATLMPTASVESHVHFDNGTSMGTYMEEILNEVIKNVEVACIQLQLPADPKLWTEEQVQNWVNWTIDQYKLPSSKDTRLWIAGCRLCELSEADIRSLAPECGDFLHAHLEIWKKVIESNNRISTNEHENSLSSTQVQKHGKEEDNTGYLHEKSILDLSESRKALQELKKAEDAIAVMTPNHTAGIHLWQFLKELLLQPQLYGQYIRWMDKETGIFKIEDSVEVARLWGIRKNRPAMNYDKLSRSIRQYYKKGIIKKTEVSQRLVYQFVKPIL